MLAGRTTTLLVTGEIGIGKSALLTAIADDARALGFRVATAIGARLESDLRGGVITRLAEGLRDGAADSLDRFHRVVRDALGRGPLLLAVDDVELSDSWSLRCLAYALRRVADQPLAVVLTATTGQAPVGEVTLPELLGAHHEHVELTGLDVDAVAALVGDVSAAACREVTRGNPKLLRALADQLRPGVTAAEVHALGSAEIGAALRARLRRHEGAAEVVRAAAVLGEDATVDRLAAMTDVEPRRALRLIDGLVRLHVFRDDYPLGFAYHLRKGTVVSMAHGMDFLARGDLVRAKTFLKWQLRLFDELGAVAVCPMAILCAARLAEVLVDLGRFDEARDLLARHGFADELPELFQHNVTLFARGKLKLATDDHADALADLLECGRRLTASTIDSPAILPWRSLAVRAHLALGRRDAAAHLAAEDLARAKRWGTPRAMGTALVSVGLTTDDEAATRALLKAVEYLTGSVARLLHAEALLELGARLRRRGHAERAIPHLRQAVELSARCESKPLIRRAAEELRACEPATAHGTVHGLTKQEARVAGMAAQGLTNRQITEALFLTRRTVELHLSGAYRKLGIAGRADLAGALRRHQDQCSA
ncbi:hypothetical protein A6A25_05855 [Saccharothrix sp. CB00851]|nr:hypothetical protein A6A25_05855 [Saccharothrix sp. CB00851]